MEDKPLRDKPAEFKQWGTGMEEAQQQMKNACDLPISHSGALMADSHIGYGLPIGGVLATRNSVIPYAVGVDIACRVKLSVLDLPPEMLENEQGMEQLKKAIETETKFGVGAKFKMRREHSVIDEDWDVSPITKKLKGKAHSQLGTSGSGNHFVEFGPITIKEKNLGIAPGKYLALMSHSGSRGVGAAVADHYSKLAMEKHLELPDRLKHLAWLDLDTEEGEEYWDAMELMGKYAAANHACIHKHVTNYLGTDVLLDIENHHNFAWKETHHGEELIVHRKGATPAGKNVLGIIPGSMASPAYVVKGKGQPESLNSAAHGAGRVMSRKRAHRELNWEDAKNILASK